MNKIRTVLVTGGAGYVGAVLVPKLLHEGYRVRALDLYIYGEHVLDAVKGHPCLEQIKGDIRNRTLLERVVAGCDAVIHLACISNDPSFDLDPELGRSINYDAFPALVEVCKRQGVRRFVYASSSSVYGVKAEDQVTENLPLEPLTDYSKYKAMCEDVLLAGREPGFVTLILRPATVCGYSPRLRLDLTVNILTNHAFNRRKITLMGGEQKRPNIHIDDVAQLYLQSLRWPDARVDGQIFNAGYQNLPLREIAEVVRSVVGNDVEIETKQTDDLRSYHISSEKIKQELGFKPSHTIQDAVRDLVNAFRAGKVLEPMEGILYSNIKTMKAIKFK